MGYPTTTEKGIVLTLGSYTLSITAFGSFPGAYPRLEPQYFDIEYSARGGAARTGTAFRPKVFWTFEGKLGLTQQETLKRMESTYLAAPSAWTIYDYTNPHGEVGAATMALAPSSTAADDGTTVLYYPQWAAEPTRAFTWSEDPRGGVDSVTFQFKEV
ncbi:MAG: hypothetical protein AAFV85_23100 [Cyanobacteria bacterium J06634_6]